MRHSRSSVHGSLAWPDEPLSERSASTQIPGDPRASEFRVRRMMDTIRWDELIEQTPEAVAVMGTDDRVLGISKEFTRMFGYERDEALGLPINDLIVPETLLDSTREHTGRLQHGQRVEGETVRRSKDGIDVHVFLLAVPITTASGEHVANYAIYRDITERKRAEERLVESEARFRTMAEKAPRYTGAGSLAAWQQRVVAAYIEEHLAEAIPLNMLARLVHLSPYYFCRAFKQSFGIPPHRYHIKRRIDCAKTLLADPVSSVTDIALDLGFCETSSFSVAFRHTTGITPTKYRRSLARLANAGPERFSPTRSQNLDPWCRSRPPCSTCC